MGGGEDAEGREWLLLSGGKEDQREQVPNWGSTSDETGSFVTR